jgi:hypothetical protein
MFDTYKVVESVLDCFKTALPPVLKETGHAPIAEWSIGYRDVVSGLHAHPAFLVKSDTDYRSDVSDHFQTLEFDVAVVLSNSDADAGYREICAYQSAVRQVLVDRHHMDGAVVRIANVRYQKAKTTDGLFFLFVTFGADADVHAWSE